MLVKLYPHDVPNYWELIKYTKGISDPMKSSYAPDRMNNLLNACLIGTVEVWIVADNKEIVACLLTTFYRDPINNTNDLCIYGFAAAPDRTIPGHIYPEMFSTITKYARKNRCTQIIALTENEYLSNMAKKTSKGEIKDYVTFNIIDNWDNEELRSLNNVKENV